MGLIFKDSDSKPVDPKVAARRAKLLSLPFAIVGILALIFLLHDELGSGFQMKRQMAMGLLSAAAVCGGIIALILGISAKHQAQKIGATKADDDEKPWLKRKDWADGRITSSLRKAAAILWIFVAFWCAASAAISLAVVPQQLHQGNRAALLTLIFPVIGLAMIFFALNTTRAWRKFGRSIFEMAAIPGALGGTLEGEIQVKTRLRPEHGLHLRLSCFRRTTTGSGKDRSTVERILWQDEKWLRADLPQTDSNATGIPVYFRLPDDQPESTLGNGDGIHWKLEASAKVPGPNFHAIFEVPVFKLPETPAPGDDPTASFQMSLDEIRQQIHSLVRVSDLPDGGREFNFPAGRNPGFAAGATVFWLIWTGVIAIMVWKNAPVIFPLVFGVMDLLMTLFTFDLWFRRSRVVVTPAQVQIETAWLAIKKQRRLPVSNVAGFAAEVGATVGHSAYYDLKIRTRDRREITVAKNLNSKPETDWLIREMTRAAAGSPA